MREMKDSGIEWIGEIPREWEISKAKYFIKMQNGSDPTTDGNVPVYGSGSESFKTCGEYKEGPTVLIGRKGTINTPRYIEGKYWNVDTAFDVHSLGKFNLKYYFYCAVSFDYKFYISQTTLPSMTQTNYENIFLPIPNSDEQRRIADFLDRKCAEIDAVIEKTKAAVEEYKKLKQSVITEAVTKGVRGPRPMKPSGVEWIGDVPEGWEIRKIKYCFDIIAGATPKSEVSEYWDGDIVWITPADYKTEDKYVYQGKRNISAEGYKSCATTIIEENNIVFSKRAPIGSVAINAVPLCTNQGCMSCVNKGGSDILYFYYVLSAFTEIFNLLGSGTTFKEISADNFSNFAVPFPEMSEQQEISDYLDRKCAGIDNILAKKQQFIKELEAYKKSLIYEYVTGKKEVKS